MKKFDNQGFTLVELIVVITILAILGTISFISMQGYSAQTRDTVRISDISNLTNSLEISISKGEKVPKPDNSIDITASGTVIGYQGEAGQNVLKNVGLFNSGKDPLEENYYTYATNINLTKYQVLCFLENGSTLSYNLGKRNKVEAKDLSKRFIHTKGEEIGILLNPTINEPVNLSGTGVDIIKTYTNYKVIFPSDESIIGTGSALYKLQTNYSCDRIKKILGSKRDGIYKINPTGTGEMDVYCDMTTDGGGWMLVTKADGNNLTFAYNSSYWTTNSVLNETNVDYNNIEYKSSLFNSMNVKKVHLQLLTGGKKTYITIDKKANSLLEIFKGGEQVTTLGKTKWMSLVDGSRLQANCNKEGFNLNYSMKARLGFISNQENDCNSVDSNIGIGLTSVLSYNSSIGNNCGYLPCRDIYGNSLGQLEINSFGYLYIK